MCAKSENLYDYDATLKGVKARYVKFFAPTNGMWLFCDGVSVNPEKR